MIRFNMGGICMIVLLLCGMVLTFITIRRMVTGQISLPGWAKFFLSAGMIIMLLITLFSMLPPLEATVTNPFISEDTHIITPVYETTATP